ncbi:hypothetical protein JCM16303_005837 [Sporobolomyces ruberrimus]
MLYSELADGSNLETFPSIINPTSTTSSPSSRVFSSLSASGPGPAIPPSSYLSSSASTTTTSTNQTTLVSASGNTALSEQPPSVSIVTSTVSGSTAVFTTTNPPMSQASGTSGASRLTAKTGLEILVATSTVISFSLYQGFELL